VYFVVSIRKKDKGKRIKEKVKDKGLETG